MTFNRTFNSIAHEHKVTQSIADDKLEADYYRMLASSIPYPTETIAQLKADMLMMQKRTGRDSPAVR